MARTVIDILEELESTAGGNAKKDILEAAQKNKLLREVFIAAFDPYTVYYVNKVKMPKVGVPSLGPTEDDFVHDFIETLRTQLATRKVTGNAAKALIETRFANMPNEQTQKWCLRILLRNLRCGVQASTVNKIWPDTINAFEVALACTLKSDFVKGEGIKLLEKVTYPVRVEPKLDGLRCIAVKKDGEVTFYTRNGTVLESPGLIPIRLALEAAPYDNVVLDGEALSQSGTWNDTVSMVMKGR